MALSDFESGEKSPKSSYVLQARSVSRSAALFSALTLLLAFYCTATHSLSPILISAPPSEPNQTTSMAASSALFQPIRVGRMELKHRLAMAPLTRFRADEHHVHQDLAVEYYGQRASEPGTLLITEATFIDPVAGGYPNVPGCFNADQVAGWKKVVDEVHRKGSCEYFVNSASW